MINWLVRQDKTLRVGGLYIGFMFFGIMAMIIDNILTWFMMAFAFYLAGLLIYTNRRYNDLQVELKQGELDRFLKRALNNNDFNSNYSQTGFGTLEAIAVDTKNELFALMTRRKNTDEFKLKVVPFSDIIETEVIENGVSINKTSKSSVVGGALVGGALAGGVGAIIGGLSGKSVSSENISSMKLNIVINDLNSPFFTLNLLKPDTNEQPVSKDSELYEELRELADKWYGIVSVAIKRNELNKVN